MSQIGILSMRGCDFLTGGGEVEQPKQTVVEAQRFRFKCHYV